MLLLFSKRKQNVCSSTRIIPDGHTKSIALHKQYICSTLDPWQQHRNARPRDSSQQPEEQMFRLIPLVIPIRFSFSFSPRKPFENGSIYLYYSYIIHYFLSRLHLRCQVCCCVLFSALESNSVWGIAITASKHTPTHTRHRPPTDLNENRSDSSFDSIRAKHKETERIKIKENLSIRVLRWWITIIIRGCRHIQ